MKQLGREELELIFDYCLGVATSEQLEKTSELIESNPEAADFVSKVQQALYPLDEWSVEPCPDYLVEKTVECVNEAASTGNEKLSELLATESARSTKKSGSTLWVNIGRRLAMAAAFMIVGSIVLSTTRYMRHKAWQTQCAAQMAGFAKGIEAYANDNQGKMPAVALSAGSPWWKVGAQGQENVSNTRHIWLLVKGGYANPNDFVCPGVRTEKLQPITDEQVMRLNDFPSRNYISYSLRLICDKSFTLSEPGRRLIISDMNPLFENLPADFSKPLKVELDDRLLNLNSINHQRKGQNVLFSDKTVKFVKTRRVDVGNDDIFTLRGKRFYEGYEIPACETDNFLAP